MSPLTERDVDRILAALRLAEPSAFEAVNDEPWRDAEWKVYDRLITPLEDAFARKAVRAFVAVGEAAVRALRKSPHEDSVVSAAETTSLGLFRRIGEEEIRKIVEKAWVHGTRQVNAALASGRRSATATKLSNPFDLNWPEVAMYILFRPRQYSALVTQTMITGFRTILARLFNEGQGIEQMAREISRHFAEISLPRARLIARTEIVAASNLGAWNSYRASRVVTGRVWLCIAGDSRVVGPGVTHVARRWHSGRLFEIRTRSGRVLTITGDHPILTRRGWVAAEFVREGDDLVRYCIGGEIAASTSRAVPYVDYVPPMISEVFESASQLRSQERMVRRVVDLDGDMESRQGDVDVVLIDGELRNRLEPTANQCVRDLLLELSDVTLPSLLRGGPCNEQRRRDRNARSPRDEMLPLPLRQIRIAPILHALGLSARAGWYSCQSEAFCDPRARAVISGADYSDGVTAQILCGDLRRECVDVSASLRRRLPAHQDSDRMLALARIDDEPHLACKRAIAERERQAPEQFHDRSLGAGVLSSQGANGHAPHVVLAYDRCVRVEARLTSCHVYDLTTATGWMVANGLIIHNSTRDDRTRDTHRTADGQERDMDAPFIVGGARMMYPGDTTLGAPIREWIQCRCALAPRVGPLPGL